MVELLDIFPTLSDLAGIDLPKNGQVMGESLVPLLRNPAAPWKEAIVSRYGAGEAVISKDYLFNVFNYKRKGKVKMANWMLIDRVNDPLETQNIALEKKSVARKLFKYGRQIWDTEKVWDKKKGGWQ